MRTAGYEPRVSHLGPRRHELGFYDADSREYRYLMFTSIEELEKFKSWLKTERKYHVGDILVDWQGRRGIVTDTQTIINANAPHYRVKIEYGTFGMSEGNEIYFEKEDKCQS